MWARDMPLDSPRMRMRRRPLRTTFESCGARPITQSRSISNRELSSRTMYPNGRRMRTVGAVQEGYAQPGTVGFGKRTVSGSGARCTGAGIAGASLKPMWSCSHLSGRGAHQLKSPATRRNAGTMTPRMTVASSMTARAVPMPNIFMKDSPLAKETNVMVSRIAALLMIRPTRPSPMTMASLFDSPESRASLIRLSKKIS